MKRLLLLLALLPALVPGLAVATPPATMSYQGVLMDNAGVLVPDGSYSLTLRLYTVSSGGSAVWTETQSSVSVSRGGFSVILGSVVPLSGLAFDVPYWLGVTVGPGTELSPRVQLASSPYSLSLRLPFAGAAASTGSALTITNSSTGPAITADPLLTVGTTARDGTVRIYENGVPGAEIGNLKDEEVAVYGGYLRLFDPSATPTTMIAPDIDGGGAGWLYVYGATDGGVCLDGNNGSGSPGMYIGGSGSASYFETNQGGNAAVQLPNSSVSAPEVLDEPGVAQGRANGAVDVPIGTTMADIVTVTLTTPAEGYVVVEADGEHAIGGSATATSNYARFQVDETTGGSVSTYHYFGSGYTGGTVGTHTGTTYAPVSVRRTYFKTAGTYTFRLEAYGGQNESLSNYVWNPTITATFFPTSYGTVTEAVTPEEAIRFSEVQRITSPGRLPQEGSGEGALVDLRELELRDAEARAQAERAHRQLIEAQMAQQQAKAPARTATTKQP